MLLQRSGDRGGIGGFALRVVEANQVQAEGLADAGETIAEVADRDGQDLFGGREVRHRRLEPAGAGEDQESFRVRNSSFRPRSTSPIARRILLRDDRSCRGQVRGGLRVAAGVGPGVRRFIVGLSLRAWESGRPRSHHGHRGLRQRPRDYSGVARLPATLATTVLHL